MSKKRKVSNTMPVIKVEVKEENPYGDDVLLARGRLKGALQELVEHSDDDSNSSEDDHRKHRFRSSLKKISKRRRSDSSPTASYHHTYVMKLFDRSVDLARFEEDTPLYTICRAWMANQPRNPQVIVKRRASTPDVEYDSMPPIWNGDRLKEIFQLPPPRSPTIGRCPSPLPEQKAQDKDQINLNYEEQPPVPRDELIRNHLQRWTSVKKKWIEQANRNEQRFEPSMQILTTIYNKAQESME